LPAIPALESLTQEDHEFEGSLGYIARPVERKKGRKEGRKEGGKEGRKEGGKEGGKEKRE
jgi:hypothetical protein